MITDLSDRGLLDETLVVVMGEFGRTPKINPTGGRDHWPNVLSVVMAGAGIEGGQIIGSSDSWENYLPIIHSIGFIGNHLHASWNQPCDGATRRTDALLEWHPTERE